MFEYLHKISQIKSDTSLIKAVVKEAHKPIEIAGTKIELEQEGMEIQLPKWAALKLSQLGLIEIKTTDEISLRDLLRILWRESREINLTKIDPQFYIKIKNTLRRLNKQTRENPQPENIQQTRRYKDTTTDIINCRMQKIIQAAISESLPPTITENMTLEEETLLKKISEAINQWKDQLLKTEEE